MPRKEENEHISLRRSGAKPQNLKGTLLRILSYMSDSKVLLLVVALMVILSAVAGIVGTYMLTPIINRGILPLVGQTLTADKLAPLIQMLVFLAIVYIVGSLCSYASNRIMVNVTNHTLYRLRVELYDRMLDLPLSYFDAHTHGELMAHFTSDVDTIRQAVSQGAVNIISSLITAIGTFAMMVWISPLMTVMIVIMLIIMLFIIKAIGSRSIKNYKEQQAAVGALNGYMEETMAGQKVVKVFTHEQITKDEFEKINERARKASTRANTFASILMPIMNNLSYINYAVSATLGAWLTIQGTIDIGSLASYLQYTRNFSNPITQISQQFNNILAALAGAERIFKVIDMKPEEDQGKTVLVNVEIQDDGRAVECEKQTDKWAWKIPTAGGSQLVELKGDVRFNNVDFSYDGVTPVLKDVSFYAKPGQKIAFVGATGAGKTTITNLINRFYDINEGTITYDGINVKDISKDSLRRSLAMVLQDTHLFTGTVRENIAYGKLDATDQQIEAAAKCANADEFIRMLPNGYDTMLTSDGANLSQGQRQLLAIARAAVADAPVLILDEATSSIDTRTEALIEQGMDNLMHGRTVFVIAHRLSTVRNANAIMVLDHGVIIERGDHDDLLKQKGKYYQLYTGQFELD